MSVYLLDTNIVSFLLRRDPVVERNLEKAFRDNATIILSPVVYYEIKRGLIKHDAKNQTAFFERLIPRFAWRDVERPDWDESARLWVNRAMAGRPIEDADLLIAAQAKRLNAILVTDNAKDFDGLKVAIENWREG